MLPAIKKLVKIFLPNYNDDGIDRLNYAFTALILVFLILVTSKHQFFGEPFQCMIQEEFLLKNPTEFKGNWQIFLHQYCENMYSVSLKDDRLAMDKNQREQYEFQHYQLIPVIFILQLLLFLAPKFFWNTVSWKTGLAVNALIGEVSAASRQQRLLAHFENKNVFREIARQMREIIKFNGLRRNRLFIPTRNYYFTTMYLLFKVLNIVNTGLQLMIMNNALIANTSYTFWGFGFMKDSWYEREWKPSGYFPLMIYFNCNDNTSTPPMNFAVQCVMLINMFHQKLYTILWFWLFGITILNAFNLLYWLIISFTDSCNKYFIEYQFVLADAKYDAADIPAFVENWITMDGLTALRLISSNAGDLTSSDIIAELYHDFCTSNDDDGKNGHAVAKGAAKKLH